MRKSTTLTTLRQAGIKLGLNPHTLYVLRDRHDDFPEPVVELPSQDPTTGRRYHLFDYDEIEAWQAARHLPKDE